MESDDAKEKNILIAGGERRLSIPMVWTTKNTRGYGNLSENWFQSMAIATVVWHDNYLYKLRMPTANAKIKYNLDITLPDKSAEPHVGTYVKVKDGGEYVKDGDDYRKPKGDEKATHKYLYPHPVRNSFRYKVPNIINYKNLVVQQPGYKAMYNNAAAKQSDAIKDKQINTLLSKTYLSPSYDAKKQNSKTSYNMKTNDKKGTQDITLKCFAFDLNKSANFITYIAGAWFITISNPFKFFSEDMRMVDEGRIAAALKQIDIDKTNNIRFYVANGNVDALLLDVYPPWKQYEDTRRYRIPHGVTFFDSQGIWEIICQHMGMSVDGEFKPDAVSSPYPDQERRKGAFKLVKKALEDNYYRFVSLRPAWNTKERFDNFFKKLKYPPDVIRDTLPVQPKTKKLEPRRMLTMDELTSASAKPASETPSGRVYENLSYTDLRTKMEDNWDRAVPELEHARKTDAEATTISEVIQALLRNVREIYITTILYKLKVLDEDHDEICDRLYNSTFDLENESVTISDLQESMVNRANSVPGKFELFQNLIAGTGIVTSDKDPKIEKKRVKELLLAKERTRKELSPKKKPKENLDDSDKLKVAKLEKTITEIKLLKRELGALQNPNWVLMKDVLAKAGAKAQNKKAVKTSVVYTLGEFDKLLDRFSDSKYTISDKDLLENFKKKTIELTNLRNDKTWMVNEEKRLSILLAELDETHTNFGNPDKEDAQFDKQVHKYDTTGTKTLRKGEILPVAQLNSKNLFRGNKGTELDAFIKKHLGKEENKGFARFSWYEGHDNTYGLTFTDNSVGISKKWRDENRDALEKGTLKYDPKMNTGETGHIRLHIHKARSLPIEHTKLIFLHELAHAKVGDLPLYFQKIQMNPSWDLDLDKNGCLQKSDRNPTLKKYTDNISHITHNSIWQAAADQLFDNNFENIFDRAYDTKTDAWLRPQEKNHYYTWSRVHAVIRKKNAYTPDGTPKQDAVSKKLRRNGESKVIWNVFYDAKTVEAWKDNVTNIAFMRDEDSEIVKYDPDDYDESHYNWIDRWGTRQLQKKASAAITSEISVLRADILNNNTPERRKIQRELDQIREKLSNRDFKVFVKLAEYLRKEISPENIIADLARLHSAKSLTKFKTDFKTIIENVNRDYSTLLTTIYREKLGIKLPLTWKSQWFKMHDTDPNRRIINKTFKDYMGAFISVCYTTDGSSPDKFKAMSSERTNGMPLALRYAMTLDGVHVSKVDVSTVEKLKKFKLEGGKYNTKFLFPKEGTKQQGLYDKTDITMAEPTTEEGYKKFHEEAAKILKTWKPDRGYGEEQVFKKAKKKSKAHISSPPTSNKMSKKKSRRRKSNMDIYLEQLGLESVPADPDGNCFFHALKQTARLDETIQDLRANIVIKLGEILDVTLDPVNPEFQIKNLIDEPYTVKISGSGTTRAETLDAYLNLMAQPNAWADSAVVMAAMVYLHRQIYLVNNKTNPEWGIAMREFPQDLLSDRPLGDPVVLTFNEGDITNGNHYQGTRIIDSGKFNDVVRVGVEIIHDSRNILAIMKRASTMKPTSVKRQSGLTCGMHAINNLLGTAYTAKDLQGVCKDEKTEDWNSEVIMHYLGVQWGRNDKLSLTGQFDAGDVKDNHKMLQFLEFEGLLGFVIHLPGHWTAMRRWDTGTNSGFSYMDSYPKTDRLQTFATAEEMAAYLIAHVINDAEVGDRTYVIYPAFLSPSQRIKFGESGIPQRKKGPGTVILDHSDEEKSDGEEDESDSDEDESFGSKEDELFEFYVELVSTLGPVTIDLKAETDPDRLKTIKKLYLANLRLHLRDIALIIKKEMNLTMTDDAVIRMATYDAPLDNQKRWLREYVKKK